LKRLTFVLVSVLLALILSGCPGTGQDPDTYTVSYDGNGYTGGVVPTDSSAYETGMEVSVLDNSGGLVKGVATFSGWYSEAGGTGTDRAVDSTFPMGSANVILYAKWTYLIGDTGPAGGLVFYDKGSYSDWWQYLEFAPADVDSGNIKEWGGQGYKITGTGTAIGTGSDNTAVIVDFHDGLIPDYYTNIFATNQDFTNPTCTFVDSNDGTVAAKLCANYNNVANGVTYSDWFLPSGDELNEIWVNIVDDGFGANNNIGSFDEAYYWSSSESNENYAWTHHFTDGTPYNAVKNGSYRVRAIRAF